MIMPRGFLILAGTLALFTAACARRADERNAAPSADERETAAPVKGRSITLPFDSDWVLESYRAGMESQLGALGGTGVKASGGRLEVSFNLDPADPDKKQLEVLRDLEGTDRDFGRTADLVGANIVAQVGAPMAIATRDESRLISGMQLFCESENKDGVTGRQYSKWENIASTSVTLTLEPTALSDLGFRDPQFRPNRVVACGLKLALNDRAIQQVTGAISVNEFRVELPSTDTHARLKGEMVASLPHVNDQATLQRLPPLGRRAPGVKVFPVGLTLRAASPAVTAVRTAPEPAGNGAQVWQVEIRFEQYGDSAAQRTARVTLPLDQPLDLRHKKVTAWVAIGPSLRGASLRPNQMQIELEDSQGHVLRGPAADLSTDGMVFDERARDFASRWVRIEAAPLSGRPAAMGSDPWEFLPAKVVKIHARFQVGKFSQLLRDEPYPLFGTLLLSEFRVEPVPPPPPLKSPAELSLADLMEDLATAALAPSPLPFEKTPVPIERFVVGINLPFYRYADVGRFRYGGRDIGGFSSRPAKLQRDFALFRKNRIDVVRVFLLGDLRTGVTRDAAGKVSGLDKYALKDLDALIAAAAANSVALCPVLIDFKIADGSRDRQYGAKRWEDGEAPEVLLEPEHRSAFIQNALRPIVQRLHAANRRNPGVVWAVDIANEIENATAITTDRDFKQVVMFVKEVRAMIDHEAPGLKVTLGSRDRRDLVRYWENFGDIHQYHFYSKHEEEDELPLSFPARRILDKNGKPGSAGLDGPVVVGEVEPDHIAERLETIYQTGHDGAFFWSYSGHDGYVVDLDQIRHWVESKRH
ncbi:MAG: hypothetical protein ABSH49_30320 [Bryobacteraceae bacterium]|jgi:hypothetical protein